MVTRRGDACCSIAEGGSDSLLGFLQAVLSAADRLLVSKPRLLFVVVALLEALWRESAQFGRHSQVVAKLRDATYALGTAAVQSCAVTAASAVNSVAVQQVTCCVRVRVVSRWFWNGVIASLQQPQLDSVPIVYSLPAIAAIVSRSDSDCECEHGRGCADVVS